jgi:DUF2075 family protein
VIVYSTDKAGFLSDNDDRAIDDVVYSRYRAVTGRKIAEPERRSWRNSLGQMANVLRDKGIPDDLGVAIEFHIPQSSKRIDVMLAGRGRDDSKNMIIVELKQWETAKETGKDAVVVTFVGKGQREEVHPSYQAWSYSTLLEGFNSAVYDGGIALHPCAYLHNYARDGAIDSPHYSAYTKKAPLFLKGEAETKRLRDFIKRHVKKGDPREILFELEHGKIRPSKALADSLTSLMKGNQEFVLIDEQKTVYEGAIAAAHAATEDQPRVVVVEGGPGTGKSVVAINLLVALTAKGLLCKYVSKNAAPRTVFQAKLTKSMTRTKFANLFAGSGEFIESSEREFDVLIVDEAHRLTEKSGLYGNKGENQIEELISAAKCTIFFVDDDQRVTLKDIGSKDLISELAADAGAVVDEHVLASQFRCGGSDGYLAWLDNALQIRDTANRQLDEEEFDFRVFDSPGELHDAIEARNARNKARVVAGYCWPWASKNNSTAFDITIGEEYRRRWNLTVQGGLWIVSPESINEVGCIHTCQGLELDYVGVIVGPDLIVREEKVRTVPEGRARQDQTIKGYKKRFKENPEAAKRDTERVIKNTYRTLMTRGMKGCYIYCTDPETNRYFKRALGIGAGT